MIMSINNLNHKRMISNICTLTLLVFCGGKYTKFPLSGDLRSIRQVLYRDLRMKLMVFNGDLRYTLIVNE